jgi:hypothetical protein
MDIIKLSNGKTAEQDKPSRELKLLMEVCMKVDRRKIQSIISKTVWGGYYEKLEDSVSKLSDSEYALFIRVLTEQRKKVIEKRKSESKA